MSTKGSNGRSPWIGGCHPSGNEYFTGETLLQVETRTPTLFGGWGRFERRYLLVFILPNLVTFGSGWVRLCIWNGTYRRNLYLRDHLTGSEGNCGFTLILLNRILKDDSFLQPSCVIVQYIFNQDTVVTRVITTSTVSYGALLWVSLLSKVYHGSHLSRVHIVVPPSSWRDEGRTESRRPFVYGRKETRLSLLSNFQTGPLLFSLLISNRLTYETPLRKEIS